MSLENVIKKALLQNDMCNRDVAVITTDKHHFIIHILEIVVLLLHNFLLLNKMSAAETFNFVMKNFETILDIILVEIEVSVLQFDSLYDEEQQTDVVELHNKDECFIIVAIQDKVNKNLERIGN